jgi:hypothetical protein
MPEPRTGTLAIEWSPDGLIGRVALDGVQWAAVEWSEQRQQWCVEDVEGRCLTHTASLRGQAASKEEAVSLAEATIRDGRMPSPAEAMAEAKERRRIAREKRNRQPAVESRKAKRKAAREAFNLAWEAKESEGEAQPLYETLDEAFDLSNHAIYGSRTASPLSSRG